MDAICSGGIVTGLLSALDIARTPRCSGGRRPRPVDAASETSETCATSNCFRRRARRVRAPWPRRRGRERFRPGDPVGAFCAFRSIACSLRCGCRAARTGVRADTVRTGRPERPCGRSTGSAEPVVRQPQLPPHWQEPPLWQPQLQPGPQPQAPSSGTGISTTWRSRTDGVDVGEMGESAMNTLLGGAASRRPCAWRTARHLTVDTGRCGRINGAREHSGPCAPPLTPLRPRSRARFRPRAHP